MYSWIRFCFRNLFLKKVVADRSCLNQNVVKGVKAMEMGRQRVMLLHLFVFVITNYLWNSACVCVLEDDGESINLRHGICMLTEFLFHIFINE